MLGMLAAGCGVRIPVDPPFSPAETPAIVGASAATAASEEAAVIAEVNHLRQANKLPLLTADPLLTAAAEAHTRDLAATGRFDHIGSDGADVAVRLNRVGYRYRIGAENLAGGTTTPAETVALWENSPGHRRNMLVPDIREAGVAHIRVGAGQYRDIWTMVFGVRR